MRHPVVQEDLEQIIASVKGWEQLSGKTVLIAGANGFLPAYMLETLMLLNEKKLFEPVQVLGVVRNKAKAEARFAGYLDRSDLRFIVQDVSDPITVEGPVDFIVHAASQASPKYYGTDPVGTLNANVLGTHNLLTLAREKGASGFLFFSSGEVYGAVDPQIAVIKETDYGVLDPLNVRSCYGESKRMGETMCVSWLHQFGVPAKVVRPFHTYGPGMQLDDGRVFADFVADIVNRRNIVMKSDGSAMRAFCYLADATVAFFTVLLHGKNGEAYNVGNDEAEHSIRDVAETLVTIRPELNLSVIRTQESGGTSYMKSKISRACPDTTRLRSLGWKPTYSIRQGFERTIRSFSK